VMVREEEEEDRETANDFTIMVMSGVRVGVSRQGCLLMYLLRPLFWY